MKTKEFIRRVEELGFKVKRFSYFNGKKDYLVYQEGGCSTVAHVCENYRYSFNTNRTDFDNLSSETRSKLFDIIVEYASTPLEKRKEEKKYHFKLNYVNNSSITYLNYAADGEYWMLSNNVSNSHYKTEFTLKQLPDWAKEMLEQGHLVKEEVENE